MPYYPLSLLTCMTNGNIILCGKDGKWGNLDATGALSIPLQYEDVEDFEDGTARVKQNGEWITIDTTGKQVTE